MSNKKTIQETLVAVGFQPNYIGRAFKVYERNYGHSYNIEVITEIIVRLQNKDKAKKAKNAESNKDKSPSKSPNKPQPKQSSKSKDKIPKQSPNKPQPKINKKPAKPQPKDNKNINKNNSRNQQININANTDRKSKPKMQIKSKQKQNQNQNQCQEPPPKAYSNNNDINNIIYHQKPYQQHNLPNMGGMNRSLSGNKKRKPNKPPPNNPQLSQTHSHHSRNICRKLCYILRTIFNLFVWHVLCGGMILLWLEITTVFIGMITLVTCNKYCLRYHFIRIIYILNPIDKKLVLCPGNPKGPPSPCDDCPVLNIFWVIMFFTQFPYVFWKVGEVLIRITLGCIYFFGTCGTWVRYHLYLVETLGEYDIFVPVHKLEIITECKEYQWCGWMQMDADEITNQPTPNNTEVITKTIDGLKKEQIVLELECSDKKPKIVKKDEQTQNEGIVTKKKEEDKMLYDGRTITVHCKYNTFCFRIGGDLDDLDDLDDSVYLKLVASIRAYFEFPSNCTLSLHEKVNGTEIAVEDIDDVVDGFVENNNVLHLYVKINIDMKLQNVNGTDTSNDKENTVDSYIVTNEGEVVIV